MINSTFFPLAPYRHYQVNSALALCAFPPDSTRYTQEVVSLWYRSPEILLGEENYSTAVDIFSVGVIMFELLLGEPAFVADTEIQMLLEIFRILGSPTEKTWPGVSRLEVE